MELFIQPPLLPNTPTYLSWVMYAPETWDYFSVEEVNRHTEDAALRRIQKQSKLFSRGYVLSLSPLHRRVRELELEYMARHYQESEIPAAIATRLRLTPTRVKKILLDTTLIYDLCLSAGMDDLLDDVA